VIDSGQHLVVLFLSYSPDDPAIEICGSTVGQLVLGGIVILPYNRFLYCSSHDRQSDLLSYKDCESDGLIIASLEYSSGKDPPITASSHSPQGEGPSLPATTGNPHRLFFAADATAPEGPDGAALPAGHWVAGADRLPELAGKAGQKIGG